MHWQKSPKEKTCYSLPTVKKLLEQKRKRETTLDSPSCSTATTSPAASNVGTVSTSKLSASTGACSSLSDMAVGYERWDPVCSYQGPSSVQESPYTSMGMSSYSSLSMMGDFSQTTAQSSAINSIYSHQPMQQSDLVYPDTMGLQPYLECPVTEAGSSSACSSWSPGAEAQGSIPTPHTPHLALGGQMDLNRLKEARVFLQGMDSWRPDEDGDTILHIYTAKGLRECAFAAAEELRELGRLDTKEHKGKTALLVAVTADQPEIVQDLLSLGADVNACDVKGQTALHLAATYGYPRVLQAIRFWPGVNLEARNFEGLTPLHCATISHSGTMKALSPVDQVETGLHSVAGDKLFCLQMLLNAGASVISQEIKSSKTVLHLAVKEGNVHLVRYLLRISITNMKEFVNMKVNNPS